MCVCVSFREFKRRMRWCMQESPWDADQTPDQTLILFKGCQIFICIIIIMAMIKPDPEKNPVDIIQKWIVGFRNIIEIFNNNMISISIQDFLCMLHFCLFVCVSGSCLVFLRSVLGLYYSLLIRLCLLLHCCIQQRPLSKVTYNRGIKAIIESFKNKLILLYVCCMIDKMSLWPSEAMFSIGFPLIALHNISVFYILILLILFYLKLFI